MLGNAPSDGLLEIEIPLDESLLVLDNSKFLTGKLYDRSTSRRLEHILLQISDIRQSRDPDEIFVDALRYEGLDYGFFIDRGSGAHTR